MFYLYLHYFQIGWDVVATLIRSVGPVYFVAMIVVFVAYHVASLASNIYLSKWTDDTTLQNFTAFPANSSLRMDRNNYYLSLYGGFGAAQGSIKFCLNFHFFLAFLESVSSFLFVTIIHVYYATNIPTYSLNHTYPPSSLLLDLLYYMKCLFHFLLCSLLVGPINDVPLSYICLNLSIRVSNLLTISN